MDAAVAADPGALKKFESVDALLDPVRVGPLRHSAGGTSLNWRKDGGFGPGCSVWHHVS